MKNFRLLIKTSRPRFWLYLAGPYLVGYAWGSNSLMNLQATIFVLHMFYFMFPANLWLYGINDLNDEDTDQFNSKKNEYENKVNDENKNHLKEAIYWAGVLGLGLAVSQTWVGLLLILFFLFLGWAYSSKRVRFKARPFWDSFSNSLYMIPGILGYFQSSDKLPTYPLVIAVWSWCSAMHLFSAIPDIQADKKALLKTSATELGFRKSLIVCLVLWLVSIGLSGMFGLGWWALIGIGYIVLPVLVITNKIAVFEAYKKFPWINAFVGMSLFWLGIWQINYK